MEEVELRPDALPLGWHLRCMLVLSLFCLPLISLPRGQHPEAPHTQMTGSPEALRFAHSFLHSFLHKCESLLGGSKLRQAPASPVPGDSCTCRAMCIFYQLFVVLGMLLKCSIYQSEKKNPSLSQTI